MREVLRVANGVFIPILICFADQTHGTLEMGRRKGEAGSALEEGAARYPSAKNKQTERNLVYIATNMYKYEYIFTCLFQRVVPRDIPVW